MADRFNADPGSGFRGNPADFGSTVPISHKGSFGSEQNPAKNPGDGNVTSSALPGNPHSSSGFRRALKATQRTSGRLKSQLPDKVTFGGTGFKKPNYFAQGGKRHGMHISTGAPHTAGAEGADAGGT